VRANRLPGMGITLVVGLKQHSYIPGRYNLRLAVRPAREVAGGFFNVGCG